MMNEQRRIVGIDLGTTNSAVACIVNGQPEIISSPEGKRLLPSVVMIDLKGKVLTGDMAKASQVAMPDRVVAAIKRKMGSDELVDMAGQKFLPQEISAMILKELKTFVDAKFDEGETEAVITVPAYFTDEQRRATKRAGELAGFVVERIVNEPTAAAMAFGLQKLEQDQHILVYDLGGGTFDVSVLEMMSGILEVKASAGNSNLGGEDFDWRIVDWLAEKMIQLHDIDPRKDIRTKSLLKEEAEKIKVALSSAEKTVIQLPLITMKENKPVGLSLEISRAEFVALIDDLLAETITCVKQVLADAHVDIADIQEVLLVGGSTRIPKVQELITGFFHKEPCHEVDPDEVVALGAAVQAGLKSGELSDSGMIVTDVAPFSLGIAIWGEYHGQERPGVFQAIIPRNSSIPVTRSERFYTAEPGQVSANVEIYQGEHELVKYNHFLGDFRLDGIPLNWSDVEPIDVTYHYNLNGILEVTATCIKNKKTNSLTVQDALARNSEQDFKESLNKLQKVFAAVVEDEDHFTDEFELEDDELLEPEMRPLVVLEKEVAALEGKIEKVMQTATSSQVKQLKKLALQMKKAVLQSNTEPFALQEIVDEIIDFLIAIEMQEES
jgi:molecular chaperone DnaK